MIETAAALPLFIALGLCLFALGWFSRWISLSIQRVVYYATHSREVAMLALFLVLFPGVLVHEAAHWLVARLLGLKTGKFRVWPKAQGKQIGMGSVSVQRGSLWQDSLVGLAPLLAGSALVALIGYHIFAADQMVALFVRGNWAQGFSAVRAALRSADSALWGYLVFAIVNAMMPSPSDREPVKPLLLYLGLIGLAYLILGLPLRPVVDLLGWLTPAVTILTSALLFTLALDAVVLVALWLVESLISPRQPIGAHRSSRRT